MLDAMWFVLQRQWIFICFTKRMVALNTCQPNSRGSMSVLDLGGGWLMVLGKLPSSEPLLSVKREGDPASGCVKILARSYWWHLEGTR